MRSREAFVRWVFDEVWSAGHTAPLGSEVTEVTFHHGGASRQADGHQLAAVIDRWREGFPDLRFEVQDLVEQHDLVAVRARLQGTHLGAWRDVAASGRTMDVDVMMFFRFNGDDLVEIWEVDDAARRDRQLGIS